MIHQETDSEMRVRWRREAAELRAILAEQKARALAAKVALAKTPAAVRAAEAAATKAAAKAAMMSARAAEIAAEVAAPHVDARKMPVLRSDGRRFECVRDAGRLYGPSAYNKISDCCKGRISEAFGFGWTYVDTSTTKEAHD